jgi:hypothetical protein
METGMKMNPEVKAKWVAALRSGKYRQGKHVLNRNNDEFCCLGVLCEILELPKQKNDIRDTIEYSASLDHDEQWYSTVLPIKVAEKLGLAGMNVGLPQDGYTLTHYNDHGKTFEEIATLIENEL